jgi:peptide deformylase
LPDMPAPKVYINPEVIWTSSETLQHDEGSVSMPGVVEKLTRAQRVRVRYQDLDGREQIEEARDFLAVCHQHEIDQLNGIFWIDRLSALKRERTVTRFKKLHRA